MATSPEDIANAAAVRRRIWEYTVQHDIAPILRPVFDRIPNFVVAEEAGCATRVAAWRGGDPIEVNPDTPDSAIHTPCASIHCVIVFHTSASALPAMGRSRTVLPTFIPPCGPVAHRGYVVSRVFGVNPVLRISFLKTPPVPVSGGTMFCANCGKPVDPSARFCMSCGAPVRPEASNPAPPVPPAPAMPAPPAAPVAWMAPPAAPSAPSAPTYPPPAGYGYAAPRTASPGFTLNIVGFVFVVLAIIGVLVATGLSWEESYAWAAGVYTVSAFLFLIAGVFFYWARTRTGPA